MEENRSRRNFLRNTALATLSAGLIPDVLKAGNTVTPQAEESCNPATLDYFGQGPFYTPGAPVIVNNQLATANETGTRLVLSGVAKTLDCSAVLPGTVIDIWHANDAGAYDTTGFNLRGVTTTNAQGFYLFETIHPGKYLNGNKYRPSHIHVKITPPGYPTVITQLYFQGDTDIPGDAAASISSGTYDATHRIIPITMNTQGKYEGTWDIVVNGNGTDIVDIHLDKGIVYSVSPNPFKDTIEIHYGVYQASRASIQVFDVNGSLVAILDEQQLKPEKYKASWNPHPDLPSGVYFVTLKINDLQVHYLKVLKE
jgi:protocatechuate 3,4-dioxygenase beta subunit